MGEHQHLRPTRLSRDGRRIGRPDAYFEPLWDYESFEELMRPKG
jgi:hypothetical protein